MWIFKGLIPLRAVTDVVFPIVSDFRFRTTMPPDKRKRSRSDPEGEDGEAVRQSPDGSESFVFFYGPNTVFSNFYPSKFVLNDTEFSCGEQYFHYAKAGKLVLVWHLGF